MMSFANVDWAGAYAFLGVVTVLCGGLMWLFRVIVARNFVSHRDHQMVSQRLSGVEEQLRAMATKDDLARIEARLWPVERGVAVVGEQVQSVKESIIRTERMVSILVESQIRKEPGQ